MCMSVFGCVCVCVYLHARLAELEPRRQLLAREHVGVLRGVEGALQLVQLVRREGRAAAAHLLAHAHTATARAGSLRLQHENDGEIRLRDGSSRMLAWRLVCASLGSECE